MRRLLVVLLFCAALAGCDKLGDSLGPEGSLQFIHAVPDLQATTIYLQQTALGTLDYSGNTGLLAVGVDTYPVRIDVRQPGASTLETLLEFDAVIDQERSYTYVLTGTAAAVDLITWERAELAFAGGTLLYTDFGHAALGYGPLDFYLEEPGANLAGAIPIASLDYREHASNIELFAGNYVLTITPRGDVNTILFQSDTFGLSTATNVLFTVLDGADVGTAPLIVRVMGDPFIVSLGDVNSPPGLRAGHSAFDTGPVDFYADGDFAAPLIDDLAYEEISPYVPAPAGSDVALDVTPATDTSMMLVQDVLSLPYGTSNTVFLIGSTDSLATVQLLDTNRRLAEFAKLRIFQGASDFSSVDIYLVKTGEDYTQYFPFLAGLGFGRDSGYLEMSPDIYDIVVTPRGVPDTILAGPQPLDLGATGIYGILIADTADTSAVDLVGYDDFAP